MARKVVRYINRFDGGITDDIRNTSDLSKCAHVAHFDIYNNPYRLEPMPGYVADQDTVAGGADDLQTYNIKAFRYLFGKIYAVGTKSNGTGSKLFEKATPTTASWTATSNGEGTYDISDYTFLNGPIDSAGNRLYFVTENGGNTYLSYYTTSVTDGAATLESSAIQRPIVSETALDDSVYINLGASDIAEIGTSSVTDPACDTTAYVTDIQSGDAQLGYIGLKTSIGTLIKNVSGIFGVWDLTANPNETIYKYDIGPGYPFALGRDGSSWVIAVSQGMASQTENGLGINQSEHDNNNPALEIIQTNGPTAHRFIRLNAKTNTNADFRPVRGHYQGTTLFYAKLPTNAGGSTFKQGIWAVGRRNSNSPLALSLLFDMDDLGSLEGYYTFGSHHFFAHGGDGSVSRLDAFQTGTYDVTATYETLVFGSETPFKKIFNGLSVLTEDLPSGASVVAKYRTDVDDSWTTIGTSNTQGDERHNFTRTSSGPIGEFQEIQFRIEVTGKAAIKNIALSYDETDDLPYNL